MSKIKLMIVRENNSFYDQNNFNPGNNMNMNNMPQFSMQFNSAQRNNIFLRNTSQQNQINNLTNTNINNPGSYNFKQMDKTNHVGQNPSMPGNLRGTFNSNLNMQNNIVNSSNANDDLSQETNNTSSPATAQVFF